MQHISVPTAPAPVGAYAQGIISADGTVYVSGQLSVDPDAGDIVARTVTDQTRQVMRNIENILKGAELTLADIVRAGIYLTDMRHFHEMDTAFAEFFTQAPARTAVGVAALPHPAAIVEIDVIAQRA
ncbi:Rid family detoxifying hydrolase [Curtobacterium flaccumfaciens]|nr:Rid family detoxifying hydrolase [Curtobacterium flaccumfaciens]